MHGATQNRLIATLDEQSEIVFVSTVYTADLFPAQELGVVIYLQIFTVCLIVYSIGAEVKCKDIPYLRMRGPQITRDNILRENITFRFKKS